MSQASARQRRGRAGRCRAGECYRLFSSARFAALAPFQLPELKRSPLEELVLQVKVLQEGMGTADTEKAADFLGRAAEPPLSAAVDAAVVLLTDIGALGAFWFSNTSKHTSDHASYPPTPPACASTYPHLPISYPFSYPSPTRAAEGEHLTRLGRHLASLPLHPRIAKMLLFANLFQARCCCCTCIHA